MARRETTVLILLDAFRWDYLNAQDTPTLWAMSQQGLHVRRLRPNLGFCERSEIFTGTRPDVSGNFTAMTYDPQNAPLKDEKWLQAFSHLGGIFEGRYVRRVLREYFRWRGRDFPLYQVPYHLLSLFALTEDSREHSQRDGFVVESLFDVMLQEGKSFYYDSFTSLRLRNGNDENRCRAMIQHASEGRDLYLLYIGATDWVIHHHGTESAERHRVCQKVDQQIEEIRQRFEACYEQVNILILGDHGMADVEHCVDVWKEVDKIERKYRLVNGRDYVMFLDSTLARFWFLKPEARYPFEALFLKAPFVERGRVLTVEMGRAYHVPAPSSKYGELIWWANPGTVVFPDYFHQSELVKAMHGYDPADDRSKGMGVVYSRNVSGGKLEEADLVDLCPTLCELVQCRYPTSNAGVSLFQSYRRNE